MNKLLATAGVGGWGRGRGTEETGGREIGTNYSSKANSKIITKNIYKKVTQINKQQNNNKPDN